MKVGLVGIHYPRPEHRDEFISRVHQVAAYRLGAQKVYN
jgi:hypothetical protein